MTITFVSIVIALLVSSIDGLGVIGDQLGLGNEFWTFIGAGDARAQACAVMRPGPVHKNFELPNLKCLSNFGRL